MSFWTMLRLRSLLFVCHQAAVPWKSFVPALLMTSMKTPEDKPLSAENSAARTLKDSIVSGKGETKADPGSGNFR